MYVDRNEQGRIIALYANPQRDGNERVEGAEIYQDPKESIKAQIDVLERQQLIPRATREFMLLFMETNFPAEALAANPGYIAVKAFDDQIKALRAQL